MSRQHLTADLAVDPLTPAQVRAARITVAETARDRDDLVWLLDVLGIGADVRVSVG